MAEVKGKVGMVDGEELIGVRNMGPPFMIEKLTNVECLGDRVLEPKMQIQAVWEKEATDWEGRWCQLDSCTHAEAVEKLKYRTNRPLLKLKLKERSHGEAEDMRKDITAR